MTDTTTKVREHYNATGLPVASPHCSRIRSNLPLRQFWKRIFDGVADNTSNGRCRSCTTSGEVRINIEVHLESGTPGICVDLSASEQMIPQADSD